MPDDGETYAVRSRLYELRSHPEQQRYWYSPHRFNVVPAGRRSGKTELAKRKLVKALFRACRPWPAAFFAGAPTRDQAKRIFWDDLKAMALCYPDLIADISDGELKIIAMSGNELWVLGLDVPARVEGKSWDGCVIDEYGNMREQAWPENIRPALSDRAGWGDLIGVPEGRNHYYDKAKMAMAEMRERGEASDWGYFHWKSSEILPAAEIEAARRELDELTFDQEYNGSFINFEGRAYYVFEEDRHCAKLFHLYNPKATLIFCFDFNVEPGSAVVIQEMRLPGEYERDAKGIVLVNKPIIGSAIIGEVCIPRNSNTPAVCAKLIEQWGKHEGAVRCYGDSTGGNRGTAKIEGSDWDLIEAAFREARSTGKVKWRDVDFRVKEGSPKERSRINAVNTRLYTTAKTIRMKLDPSKAPSVQKDFEGVKLLKGGSGEIDKKATPKLTHWTDGIGYYCDYEYPIIEEEITRLKLGGH